MPVRRASQWQYALSLRFGAAVPAPTGRTGRRSAFPGRSRALRGGGCTSFAPLRGAVPTGGRRSRACVLCGPVAVRALAALRAAVPAPTGRTGRRSAFPCRCLVQASGGTRFRCALRSGAGPHREKPHDRAVACTPRRHENAVPWTVPLSALRHHAERRAGKGRRPLVGTARRRRAAGKDPEFGGAPLGREPGVQRDPDGCVVHAFRCPAGSGAGRRSAFPSC